MKASEFEKHLLRSGHRIKRRCNPVPATELLRLVEDVIVSQLPKLKGDARKVLTAVAGRITAMTFAVECDYCKQEASLVTGKVMYPHRSDLWHKGFWLCPPCDAYVGCHEGTSVPLGRLANKELRDAKMRAHNAFDPLWQSRNDISRGDAYRWLAHALDIPRQICHIGMFDCETCYRVVRICTEANPQVVRSWVDETACQS